MNTPDPATATWRKSSRSSPDGQCTEVADLGNVVSVRDSKDPAGPTLRFSPTAWTTFVAGLKGGVTTR